MSERERFERAAELFLHATRLAPDQIDPFLDAQCGGDSQLRQQVNLLLGAADDAAVFRTLAEKFETMQMQMRREAETPQGDPSSIAPLEKAGP